MAPLSAGAEALQAPVPPGRDHPRARPGGLGPRRKTATRPPGSDRRALRRLLARLRLRARRRARRDGPRPGRRALSAFGLCGFAGRAARPFGRARRQAAHGVGPRAVVLRLSSEVAGTGRDRLGLLAVVPRVAARLLSLGLLLGGVGAYARNARTRTATMMMTIRTVLDEGNVFPERHPETLRP